VGQAPPHPYEATNVAILAAGIEEFFSPPRHREKKLPTKRAMNTTFLAEIVVYRYKLISLHRF
jgi:hypothetical protein